MNKVINFPSRPEHFKKELRKKFEAAIEIFDKQVRDKVIEDIARYCDILYFDEKSGIEIHLPPEETLSANQVAAVTESLEAIFNKVHIKQGLFMKELIELRLHKATCEMLHSTE